MTNFITQDDQFSVTGNFLEALIRIEQGKKMPFWNWNICFGSWDDTRRSTERRRTVSKDGLSQASLQMKDTHLESREPSKSTKGMTGFELALEQNAPPDQPNWMRRLREYRNSTMIAPSDAARRSLIRFDPRVKDVLRSSCVFFIRGIPYVIPLWIISYLLQPWTWKLVSSRACHSYMKYGIPPLLIAYIAYYKDVSLGLAKYWDHVVMDPGISNVTVDMFITGICALMDGESFFDPLGLAPKWRYFPVDLLNMILIGYSAIVTRYREPGSALGYRTAGGLDMMVRVLVCALRVFREDKINILQSWLIWFRVSVMYWIPANWPAFPALKNLC